MIDDDTLRHLLRIYDDLVSAMQMVDEKHDIEVSSRLIPLVDEHTHLLIEAEKNKCNERHENAETCRRLYLAVVVCGYFSLLSAFLCCFSSY